MGCWLTFHPASPTGLYTPKRQEQWLTYPGLWSQCLEQWLAQSRCSINICSMDQPTNSLTLRWQCLVMFPLVVWYKKEQIFREGRSKTRRKRLGTAEHLLRPGHWTWKLVHVIHDGEGNGTPLQYSCLENPMDGGAWEAAVHAVAKSRTWLSNFTFTFHFHALEKEMATHSSVLAWRIPGMGKSGGLLSMGSHRVRHNWSDLAAATAFIMMTKHGRSSWLVNASPKATRLCWRNSGMGERKKIFQSENGIFLVPPVGYLACPQK